MAQVTLHPTPFTPHPTPYTLHPTPYTLHPAPYTLHTKPYTLHLTPQRSRSARVDLGSPQTIDGKFVNPFVPVSKYSTAGPESTQDELEVGTRGFVPKCVSNTRETPTSIRFPSQWMTTPSQPQLLYTLIGQRTEKGVVRRSVLPTVGRRGPRPRFFEGATLGPYGLV